MTGSRIGGDSDLLGGLSVVVSEGARGLELSAAGCIEARLLGKDLASSSTALEKGLRLRRKVQRLLPLTEGFVGDGGDGGESGSVAT